MPVPQKVRDDLKKKQDLNANAQKYKVATIEGKNIFLQEAEWVLHYKKPIPKGKLVCHKDGNPLNNNIENLDLVEENDEHGDFHLESNKVFHEQNLEDNKDFIKFHFDDIYNVLFENKIEIEEID